MSHIWTVLKFSWPYMRKYWGRMVLSIVLAMLYGLTNASFMWVTQTIVRRLQVPKAASAASVQTTTNLVVTTNLVAATNLVKADEALAGPATTVPSLADRLGLTDLKKKASESVERVIDPWLPSAVHKLDWKRMLGGLLILPIMVGISRYIGYLATYCTNWVSQRIVGDLQVSLLEKLNSLSLDFFNRSKMGDLLTRINSDTGVLQRCMSLGLNDLIKEPLTVIGVFTAMMLLEPKLTLLAVVFLPLCLFPLFILGKKVRKAIKNLTLATVSQASLLVESLTAIRVVKAFGLEEQTLQRYRKFIQQSVHHNMKNVQAKELVNPLIEVVSMLGVGTLVLYVAGNKPDIPNLMAFFVGVGVMFAPIKKLANIPVFFAQATVGVNRLMQIFQELPSVREPGQPKPFTGFKESIVFENVSFGYQETPVIQNVNLAIPRGFRLGIAGESGCGKSTLVNLVFRFYDPTTGMIRIDGVNLREIASADLRRQMALVSQEVVIFDNTIAENIACGKSGGATQPEIEAAARMAYAHEFIMQKPQGYDTRVGERGVELSMGQRQRLCIARAFIRNAPILVLDEATASLDAQSEAEVQAAIDRLEENRTVICIAHRLSTLAAMDKIIVLEKGQGRIIEEGTFKELLERRGVFADMAKKQGLGQG